MPLLSRVIAIVLLAGSLATFSLAQDEARGVLINEGGALDGYTLIAPQFDHNVYLIDNDGRVINEWYIGSNTREAHLQETGNVIVLKAPREELDKSLIALGYGTDGAVAEYSWDGELVWEYVFDDPRRRQHHGVDILPNGNILALVWDYHHLDEAVAKGLHPDIVATSFAELDSFLPDTVLELNPASARSSGNGKAGITLSRTLTKTCRTLTRRPPTRSG